MKNKTTTINEHNLDLSKRCWKTRELSEGVLGIDFDVKEKGWEQYVMLRSDAHHDNAHCRRDLELEHLELARERDAPILDFGDLFCAMSGPRDPRRSQSHLKKGESDGRDDYFTAILEEATKFYSPYSDLLTLLSQGNHESAQIKNSGIDLTRMLVNNLNNSNPHTLTHRGGYAGWVRFSFKLRKTVGHKLDLRYAHGSGGGSYTTKGVSEFNKYLSYVGNVDFMVSGHNHESTIAAQKRESLSQSGKVHVDLTQLIRTGCYKCEWEAPLSGWAVEKGLGPKPLGCAWIRLFWNGGDRVKSEVVHTII